MPGAGDNRVCSEARRTIWELKDTCETGEDLFIQIGLEIK